MLALFRYISPSFSINLHKVKTIKEIKKYIMGRHNAWRKIAKRERRRRIRTLKAIEKDNAYNSEEYIKEQQLLHTIDLEMIESANAKENEKWLEAERIATKQWEKIQEKRKKQLQEQIERENKQRLEWEMEQQRKKAHEEKIKAIEEENRARQEKFMKTLEDFLSGDSRDPPTELLIANETKPESALCPFFAKTGCCRFGDMCSRNHQHSGISKVLLATNFFNHFGMEHATPSEYDTDIMLEYEEIETYKQFKEFFFDVLEEFEKFGKIVMFKVCNNMEKHLRGNVYVEYDELRCAVAAYRALHTRWYGGRQLSLQFCLIKSWKGAICGLQYNKCPKGRACNYLHVFKNPNKLFTRYDTGERDRDRSPSRSWRWSESPELDIPRRSDNEKSEKRKRDRDLSKDRSNRKKCDDDRKEKRHKDKSSRTKSEIDYRKKSK